MPSYLDLGVLGIILISALLSLLRGFTREVLAIGSWAAAAAAAYYFYPHVQPYLDPYIHKQAIAQAVAAAIVFFATLIVVSLFTVRVSDAILDSKIGALDRSLGFALRRRARLSPRRRRVFDFQLAGRRQAATRLGEDRQDAAGADRNRQLGHRPCCRRTPPPRSRAGSNRRASRPPTRSRPTNPFRPAAPIPPPAATADARYPRRRCVSPTRLRPRAPTSRSWTRSSTGRCRRPPRRRRRPFRPSRDAAARPWTELPEPIRSARSRFPPRPNLS